MKMVAPCNNSKPEFIIGREYLFLIVMLSNPRKSIQGLNDLAFYATKKNPAPIGDVDGRNIPAARESVM